MFEKTLLPHGSRELNWISLFAFAVFAIVNLSMLATASSPVSVIIGIASIVLLCSGLQTVPLAAIGVPVFFGKRLAGLVFTEGLAWAPTGIIDIHTTTATLRTLTIPATECFSRDRARMVAMATLQYQAVDPSRVLGIGYSEELALTATCQEALSRFLAIQNAERAITKQGTRVHVAHEHVASWSRRFGIGGVRLQITSVRVADPALNSALESRLLKKWSVEGDRIQNSHVASLVRDLQRKGFSRQQAIDVVQVERGTATRAVKSYTFHGTPPIQIGSRPSGAKSKHRHKPRTRPSNRRPKK